MLGLVLTISVFGVLAGCDNGDGGAAANTPGDAEVEAVRHARLADYGHPVFEVEHLIAIGAEDGPPEYVFGEIAGLDVLADGTIAVLEGHAGEVRTFAPDGSVIRRIGSKGEGPGEISGEGSLALVAVSPNGFLIPDIGNQTVNVHSLAGAMYCVTPLRRTGDLHPRVAGDGWRPAGCARFVSRQRSAGAV